MKFRNLGFLLVLLAIALSLLGVLGLVVATCFIWIPLLIIFSPIILGLYLLIKYTKVRFLLCQ